jgi:transposase-like protein
MQGSDLACDTCQLKAIKAGKAARETNATDAKKCKRRFQAERDKPLGNMYLPEEKALLVLRLLLEVNSIRSIERITGIEKNHLRLCCYSLASTYLPHYQFLS